jgi:hypothetical protein
LVIRERTPCAAPRRLSPLQALTSALDRGRRPWAGKLDVDGAVGFGRKAARLGLSDASVNALAIDPITPSTLYAGTSYEFSFGVLFKSTDGGDTWRDTGLGFTTALAIDPITPSTLYAGGSAVFRSMNAGATWAAANAGLPETLVSSLVVDPVTPSTLYATVGNIFRSTDAATSWNDTGFYASDLVIDPIVPSTLYAGNSDGVFKSTDASVTWEYLRLRNIRALAIDPITPSTARGNCDNQGVGEQKSMPVALSGRLGESACRRRSVELGGRFLGVLLALPPALTACGGSGSSGDNEPAVVYVVNRCSENAQGQGSFQQALHVRQGERAPVPVMELSYPPATLPRGICALPKTAQKIPSACHTGPSLPPRARSFADDIHDRGDHVMEKAVVQAAAEWPHDAALVYEKIALRNLNDLFAGRL